MDLGFTSEGSIVGGYGDWNSNIDSFGPEVGRPSIRELDPVAGTWTDPVYTGSEANDRIIEALDGSLLIPQTDPSDKAGTGQPYNNIPGYWTNENGVWELVEVGDRLTDPQVHTFDAWRLPDGTTLVAGAEHAHGGSAVLWRAGPGSRDFERVFQHADGTAWSRAYWVRGDAEGNAYFGVASNGAQGIWKLAPGADEAVLLEDTSEFRYGSAETFDGGVVTANAPWWSSDGLPNPGSPIDLYVDRTGERDVLWALLGSGDVMKLEAGQTAWERVMKAPSAAVSLAHRDGVLYFGSAQGEILIREIA